MLKSTVSKGIFINARVLKQTSKVFIAEGTVLLTLQSKDGGLIASQDRRRSTLTRQKSIEYVDLFYAWQSLPPP